jgi:ABC-type multidrug transport system ATPase subunit
MKTCPHCRTFNAAGDKFCRQCGRPLEAAPVDATVHWTGQTLSGRTAVRQNIPVASLFVDKQRLVIGRAPDCDVCLAHPSVSRYHALLERLPEGLHLRDLGSVNGISIDGHRLNEMAFVREGQRVGIGPFLFTLVGGAIQSLDSSRSLRLEARGLEKVIRTADGGSRKLLDNVNLVINPGEFVSLLGPSGSGKSTLMDALNGRRRATGGKVLANGEDFYQHFDNFRQSLGYVPQKDIVHTQLTVHRALYYTARLRLPTDTGPDELKARVEAVLAEMELGPHRDTLIGNLSGGQIKRVSLGAELLARPCMLYIDEATSGLDAGTEARMMRLFRRLADEGRSLLCITHNVDNVERCHLIIVLARGRLVYFGPPGEAPVYFKVSRINEIYDRLAEKDTDAWAQEYAASSLCKEYVTDRLAASAVEEPAPTIAPEEAPKSSSLLADGAGLPSSRSGAAQADRFRDMTSRLLRWRELVTPLREGWHQFLVLTARYVDLILGDGRGLRLLLWQAPIVAVFLLIGFVDKKYQEKIPLRFPTEDERVMLRALKSATTVAGAPDKLTEEDLERLRKIKVDPDRYTQLDGEMLWAAARLSGLPEDSNLRKRFAQVRFSFPADGEEKTMTGDDLLKMMKDPKRGELLDKLLTSADPMVPDPDGPIVNPRQTYTLLFVLVMIILWFGCNNAAKEIVKEEPIYARERSVNLGILPYLASKFLVLTAITALHVVMLMAILYGTLHLLHLVDPARNSVPYAGHMLDYVRQFGVLLLLGMTGVALGLLLSACVATPDRANALLPYVLIPQMILGGGFITIRGQLLTFLAMTLSPVYWAYRAIALGKSQLPPSFPGYSPEADDVVLPCVALTIQLVLLLLATAWFLKRKEV